MTRSSAWSVPALLAIAAVAVAVAIAALVLAAEPAAGELEQPSIALTKDGQARVLYSEVGRPGLRLAVERPDGRWTREVVAPTVDGAAVAVDSADRTILLYTTADGLFAAMEGTNGWRRTLVDREGRGRPSLAVAPGGTAYALYTGRTGRLKLARLSEGGRWMREVTVLDGTGPRIVATAGVTFSAASRDQTAVVSANALRPGAGAGITGVVASRPPALAVAGARPVLAYHDDRSGLVYIVREPWRLARLRPSEIVELERVGVAPAALMDVQVDAVGDDRGVATVLYREPVRNWLAVDRRAPTALRGPQILVGPGRRGALAVTPDGRRAIVAHWDPAGRVLLSSRAVLEQPFPRFTRGVPISAPQLPTVDRAALAIWLSALSLALSLLAASLLVLRSGRRGVRLLPFAIVGAVLAGAAVRALYVGYSGSYGLYPHDRFVVAGAAATTVASSVLILAAATWTLGLVGLVLPPARSGRALVKRFPQPNLPSRAGTMRALAVFLLTSVAALSYVVLQAGGIGAVLAARQSAFAERGYALLLVSAAAGAFLAHLAVGGIPGSRRGRALLAVTGAGLAVVLLLTGARSTVLLGFVLPALLVLHLCVRPIPARWAIVALAVLAVAALAYRTNVREADRFAADPQTPTTQVERLLGPVLAGPELGALDGLVLVRAEYLPRFGIEPTLSARALLAAPVPRAIWPSKPRGAMATFTSRVNPFRYKINEVEVTTSLAGDFAMNGGVAGVLVGFGLLGLLLVMLGELAAGAGGVLGVLVAATLIPRLASATWGDLQNATLGGLTVLVSVVTALVVAGVLARDPGSPHGSDSLAFRRGARGGDDLEGEPPQTVP